jgi:hypothetical protein
MIHFSFSWLFDSLLASFGHDGHFDSSSASVVGAVSSFSFSEVLEGFGEGERLPEFALRVERLRAFVI